MSMLLGELCKDILAINASWHDLPVDRIVCDSRKAASGDLFIAVAGFESDGHQYIQQAVSQGASAVIAESGKDVGPVSVPVIRTENSRLALARLAGRFFGHDEKTVQLLGVTGTNGKTTVGFLLEHLFNSASIPTGLIGTVVYRCPAFEENAPRTTPDILELHDLLQRMERSGSRQVVMEVSSHALALHRVAGLTFDAAVFTNLTRDHLDFHGDLETYGREKAKLFAMLDRQGVAVINQDDAAAEMMLTQVSGRAVTYGLNKTADYRIGDIEMTPTQSSFSMVYGGRAIPFTTRLLGRFNILNMAAAIVTGLEMGLSEEAVQAATANAPQIPGRMQRFDALSGFRVLIDYAHTPDALQNVLIASREFTTNRLISVFGCGGDRDKGKRPQMGRISETFADISIVTSDNPRTENPRAIIQDIIDGMEKKADVIQIEDRRAAIHHALNMAEAGDIVVIAGKGHEPYQEIGKERFPFDDRDIAAAFLKDRGEV